LCGGGTGERNQEASSDIRVSCRRSRPVAVRAFEVHGKEECVLVNSFFDIQKNILMAGQILSGDKYLVRGCGYPSAAFGFQAI
jgi:hypothetical protein